MPKAHGLVPETIKIGAIVSAIGAAYKIGEFLLKTRRLYGVESENAVLERLLRRVQLDLAETRRLLQLPAVQAALRRSPAKADWVYGVVNDTIAALAGVQEYTQHVSEDVKRGGAAGIRNRIMWVLEEKDAILHRQMELATCHQSLTQVMVLISRIERGVETDSGAQQWSRESGTGYSYGARQRYLVDDEEGQRDDYGNISYARTRSPRDSRL